MCVCVIHTKTRDSPGQWGPLHRQTNISKEPYILSKETSISQKSPTFSQKSPTFSPKNITFSVSPDKYLKRNPDKNLKGYPISEKKTYTLTHNIHIYVCVCPTNTVEVYVCVCPTDISESLDKHLRRNLARSFTLNPLTLTPNRKP